ncbi:glycosyltransferase [Microvirga aerophila]|uniref:glycosyltransferase n=1 Tax=Microvirga aerophila TaxID=670291 RepID=UPI000DEFA8E7|nr:glycosyltransferase [Microvirga aerophila]
MCERKLRIAHITEAPLGGVVTHLQELISVQVLDRRVEAVVTLSPEINSEVLNSIKSEKLQVNSIRYSRGSPIGLARLAISSIRLIRSFQPDILHLHSTIAGAVIRTCLLFVPGRPKVIYCPHSWAFTREDSFLKNKAIAVVERLLSYITDGIVCVSDCEKEDAVAAGIAPSKCTVIANGVHHRPISALLNDRTSRAQSAPLKILFVGRFDRQKGFDVFIDVMKELRGNAEGLAIGSFVIDKSDPIKIPPNVVNLGWRSREEVQEIYSKVDLLLMPSRWEGLPIVALEAMRAGIPIFASRVGGLKEVVIDGVTGKLFDPEQSNEIAEMIRSANKETLRAYGLDGRARFVRHYRSEVMSERMTSLYLTVSPNQVMSSH